MKHLIEAYHQAKKIEIEEHQYFMGINQSKPVTYEEAEINWLTSGESRKFHERFYKHLKDFTNFLKNNPETLTKEQTHRLLEDAL